MESAVIRVGEVWDMPAPQRQILSMVLKNSTFWESRVHDAPQIVQMSRQPVAGYELSCLRFDNIHHKNLDDTGAKAIEQLRDFIRNSMALVAQIILCESFNEAWQLFEANEQATHIGRVFTVLMQKAETPNQLQQVVAKSVEQKLPLNAERLNLELKSFAQADLTNDDVQAQIRGIFNRYKQVDKKLLDRLQLSKLRNILWNHFDRAPMTIKRLANDVFEALGDFNVPFKVVSSARGAGLVHRRQ